MKSVLLATLVLFSPVTLAHKPSDSYLRLLVREAVIEGEWDIALRDLEHTIGLDTNDDGVITWGEVRKQQAAISRYTLSRLKLSTQNTDCARNENQYRITRHSDGSYVVLLFTAICTQPITDLTINYDLFFEFDPQHRGLLQLNHRTEHTAVFHNTARQRNFNATTDNTWQNFNDYVVAGARHIAIGYDHILFLITLLLPAVLRRDGTRWLAIKEFRSALTEVFSVVSSFTFAHSLTLALATLGILTLPSRLVESAIAVTVIFTAVNNLFPVILNRRWQAAFILGLIHGLGFATVLNEVGLNNNTLLLSLLGFNIGVEIGQLALIITLLPLLYTLRDTHLYQRWLLGAGSLTAATVGIFWLIERALDVTLLS